MKKEVGEYHELIARLRRWSKLQGVYAVTARDCGEAADALELLSRGLQEMTAEAGRYREAFVGEQKERAIAEARVQRLEDALREVYSTTLDKNTVEVARRALAGGESSDGEKA